MLKSTDGGSSWGPVNTDLDFDRPGYDTCVDALAVDPITPSTIYAGTNGGGVFAIQQVAACIGDCNSDGQVTINELLTLVNIALGSAQPSACPQGIPSGAEVDVALIIQAVDSALNGCGG